MEMIELSDMNAVRLVVIGIGLVGKKHAELVSASDTCSLVGGGAIGKPVAVSVLWAL